MLLALGAVVVVAGIGWAAYDLIFTRNLVSTDDAYVSGDVVQVTSEVPGTVIALHADDTQAVKRGDGLIELDPADAAIAMRSAEAGLAQAVRNVKAQQAQADQLRAQINARRGRRLKRAEDDTRRRAALIATGAVSREDFSHAQDTTTSQTAALAAARAQLEQTLAQIGNTPVAACTPMRAVLRAAAKLRNAALALHRTRIMAPIDGEVARRNVKVGQRVEAGTPLMAVVPLEDVWIDANFKEVQLQRMRVGQPVTVTTDIYGGKVSYHGKVAGLSAGSGNAFALLPPQNATGNWIKIVQRVPVRILLDPRELKANPLRIGLSTTVYIDVSDSSGAQIAGKVRNQPFPSEPSDAADPAVDALIAKIIAENGGAAEICLRRSQDRPMSGPAQADDLPPLKGGALALTAIALALGTFMQVLDSSIANVSIPTIAGNLGVSPDQGTWVITSFAVSNGISVPVSAFLMQRFGVVRTFVISVILFTLASLLCGISWSLGSLVFFRVVQGAVSGPMIPGSQALLIAIFPPQKRGTALAIWSMTTLIAPICGPIFGGYISDNFTWPWIFLINLPVGIVCAAICWRMLKTRETPTRKVPIDRIGFALLVVWVGCLQVALDKGKDADWFASPLITTLIVITVIGFVAWLIWELTDANPIVDLSLFKSRNFAIGTLAFCLGYGLLFGNLVLLPLWLQTQLNYTATWAGLVAAPAGIAAVVLSPIAARVMSKVDARWTATLSFVAFAISYLMRANYTPDASFAVLMMPMIVQGIAMSVFFVSMLTILLNGIPPQKIPAASGLSNFARITAGGFAASLTTVIWDRREAVHQSRFRQVSWRSVRRSRRWRSSAA